MKLKELVGKHYLSGFDTSTEKSVDSWHEDFEVDAVAFTLEWAAQMLVKYGPDVLPEFKPPVRRVRK